MALDVKWIDGGREPQCAPDPRYPEGIDLCTEGVHCTTALPYPARRCGWYRIDCDQCGAVVLATTAGRPDDPRSIQIPCRGK